MPADGVRRRSVTIVLLLVLSVTALLYSLTYEIGDLTEPGPGMWPIFGSAVMVVGSVTLFLVRGDSPEEYERYSKDVRDVLLALFLAAAWLILLEHTGLIIPTFGFLLAWVAVISRESWKLALSVAAVGAILVYAVFDTLLGIPFPRDVLATMIGL